jgi:mycothiol synthase
VIVTTVVPAEENERHRPPRVYVSGVSVRRPWRRRGLARALLASSLVGAREAGFTSASLGVDADSPTGSDRRSTSRSASSPERTFTAYRKPL